MNANAKSAIGIGLGLGVLVAILVRPRSAGAIRITGVTAEPTYKWDPVEGKCMRKVPVGVNPDGSTRFTVDEEPDATMCFGGDVSPATTTTGAARASGEGLAFAPNTIPRKTTDAIESVMDKARAALASLLGRNPSGGALAGAVESSTDDVEGF